MRELELRQGARDGAKRGHHAEGVVHEPETRESMARLSGGKREMKSERGVKILGRATARRVDTVTCGARVFKGDPPEGHLA